jgi:hypothetical protein
MKVRGPLVTLGAVAALGGGMWLANVSQETEAATPSRPVAESTAPTPAAQAPAPPSTPLPPPPASFPAKADYVGKIPTKTGVITLDITVEGNKAKAYACDGNTVEAWLSGSAENGVVKLWNKDRTSRLDGRLEGSAVVGTLWIGDKNWGFTAPAVQSPAGLYVYEGNGIRNSWIIDSYGAVTGVQRQPDGSTSPAPILSTDGTAVIDGRTVIAVRVEGDGDG